MPAKKRAPAKRGRTVDADAKASGLRGVAEEAKRRARAAGAEGRAKERPDGSAPLSPAARQMRDTAIVASIHAGETTAEVAEQWKISPRTVERIVQAFNSRRSALDAEPMETVEWLARTYEELIRDYAVVAAQTVDKYPAVAVGAMRARQHAMERYSMLLGALGKLPNNLALLPSAARLRTIADQMFDLLTAVARGELPAEEALVSFDELIGATWAQQPRELPPGEAA